MTEPRFSSLSSHAGFRGTIFFFAFALGCLAAWNLAIELTRADIRGFPVNAEEATAAALQRPAAFRAASLGLVRGELWTECAITYLGLFWNDGQQAAAAELSETITQARTVAERAISYSPHDAKAWLVFASLNSQYSWVNRNAAAALKMSYYTGPNEIELIPLRLLLSIQSEALQDSEFQELVRHDMRIIVAHKPKLRPALVVAYREALPIGKQFIEKTLEELDPALLSSIRS